MGLKGILFGDVCERGALQTSPVFQLHSPSFLGCLQLRDFWLFLDWGLEIVDATLPDNPFDIRHFVDHVDTLAPVHPCRLEDPDVLAFKMTHWHDEWLVIFELTRVRVISQDFRSLHFLTFLYQIRLRLQQPVGTFKLFQLVTQTGIVNFSCSR